MSDPVFTILEPPHPQNSSPFSPSAPTIGWGIALLCVGIFIGKQMNRQQSAATAPENAPSSADRRSFTQPLQWVSYGKSLERQERYEDAIAVYDQGLSQHPNDFRLWHERGLALAKLLRFEEARDSFDCAYRLRPKDGDLAHERGDTLLQLEQFEDAIASFDIYLKYHPNNAHVMADRGYALYRLGRFEDALQCLNRVLKTERSDRFALPHAHYYQIESLRCLGQLEAALQSSQQAIIRYSEEHFIAQHEAIRQQMADFATSETVP